MGYVVRAVISKIVPSIRRCVDIGESSLDMVQVPSFCKARKVLFLLQESAASASSPDGLERSSNVSAKFVASFVQCFSFVQQRWLVHWDSSESAR